MLVLEDLETALERGATIYGELLGYGATCEAFHRVRLNESGEEPARAMELAMVDAGLASDEIDYLQLHGNLDGDSTTASRPRRSSTAFGNRARTIPASSLKSMIVSSPGRLWRRGGRRDAARAA